MEDTEELRRSSICRTQLSPSHWQEARFYGEAEQSSTDEEGTEMTCKSAIMTANTSSQELLANAPIPFGSIVRRYGRFCNLAGSDIVIGDYCSDEGCGYYKVDCSVTLQPTAEGNVTVQLYVNGEPYSGASAAQTVAAAGDTVTLSFPAIVRLFGCCTFANLQVCIGEETATMTNYVFTVEKI